MGVQFNRCVKVGGRVRRVSRGNSYQNFCFDSRGSHAGEIKKKKGRGGSKKKWPR